MVPAYVGSNPINPPIYSYRLMEKPSGYGPDIAGSNPAGSTIWDSSPTGRGVGFKLRMFWVRIPGVLPFMEELV